MTLLRLLLKVTEVTTEHKTWPKIGTNRLKSFFQHKGQKKTWPKTSAGARSTMFSNLVIQTNLEKSKKNQNIRKSLKKLKKIIKKEI